MWWSARHPCRLCLSSEVVGDSVVVSKAFLPSLLRGSFPNSPHPLLMAALLPKCLEVVLLQLSLVACILIVAFESLPLNKRRTKLAVDYHRTPQEWLYYHHHLHSHISWKTPTTCKDAGISSLSSDTKAMCFVHRTLVGAFLAQCFLSWSFDCLCMTVEHC